MIQVFKKVTGVENSQEIASLINKIDHNKSGKIDFNEFLIAM